MDELLPDDPASNELLQRMNTGDRVAREELFRLIYGPLHQLTTRWLARFPRVCLWEESEDVLDDALCRLLATLEAGRPASVPDLAALAATVLRRELLDHARRYAGRAWRSAHADSEASGGGSLPAERVPDAAEDPEDLQAWSMLHEKVARLPCLEREVLSLALYHGWTQVKMAELFQVSERTIRNRWQAALEKVT